MKTKKVVTLAVSFALILCMTVPALATTITKTAQLAFNNIKITLNGNELTPKDTNGNTVEPFIIDGTTYLPVRAVSNALGMNVDWNSSSNTVELQSNTADFSSVQAMGYYKIIADDFDSLYTDFNMMQTDINWVMDTKFDAGTTAEETYCHAVYTQIAKDLSLVEGHYNNCKDFLSSDGVDLWYEYKRLANLAISYYKELDNNPNQSFIDRVVGASSENSISSQVDGAKANTLFWAEYHAA